MPDEKLTAAMKLCLAALKAWEAWEAGIIMDDKCWAPDGTAAFPRITDPHYTAMIHELQPARNAAIAAASALEAP